MDTIKIVRLKEHTAKDMILNLLVEDFDKTYRAENIKERLFPDESIKVVEYLLRLIDHEAGSFVEFQESQWGLFINGNELTQKFLANGGFTGIYKIKEDEESTEKENKALKDKIDSLEYIIKSREVDHGWVKFVKDYVWLTVFVVSTLAFLAGLIIGKK